MAHQIEQYTDGTAGFVTARQHAWHRLGTVLPDAFTAEQAMNHAKLGGWNVRTEPLTTTVVGDDGVTILDVPDHFATVRTHPLTGQPEVLGVVGAKYRPIQNEQHADLLNLLVDESGAHFETAGSLRGGRQVFLTMKIPAVDDHRRPRPGRPVPGRHEQPRRNHRLPTPGLPRPGRLRQHPGRSHPRRQVLLQHPPHRRSRRGSRPSPRRTRTDLPLRRRLPTPKPSR